MLFSILRLRFSKINFSLFASIADKQSSKILIEGFIKIALAIDNLCLWPPESWTPLSPIKVPYLSGNWLISSVISAVLAASITSDSVNSFFPKLIFSLTVPENRKPSWGTYPIFLLSW